MSIPLIVESMVIRGFKSFGDYDTTVSLSDMGPVLIVGSVDEMEGRSNGAGKTTIPEALIWCLHGRLSDLANPGDKVVNWDINKNCMVKVIAKGGYEIIRTRKMEGHSDLLILKDGEPIPDGDSTNSNAQKTLNTLFNLNFNTFISSLYFGQASGSYLSLSPAKQRDVIEKLFGLRKLSFYAKIAKDKLDAVEKAQKDAEDTLGRKSDDIDALKQRLEGYIVEETIFEDKKKSKIINLQQIMNEFKENKVERVNIADLEKEWEVITAARAKIAELEKKVSDLDIELEEIGDKKFNNRDARSRLESKIERANNRITFLNGGVKKWEEKEGTVCPTCEQTMDPEFLSSKVDEVRAEIKDEVDDLKRMICTLQKESMELLDDSEFDDQRKAVKEQQCNIQASIDALEAGISKSSSGKMTITEANSRNKLADSNADNIKRYKDLIEEERATVNPYTDLIAGTSAEIKSAEEEIAACESDLNKWNKIASHLAFVHKAYAEKRHIRSFMISGRIPQLNNRLGYYFNEFGLSRTMYFNEMLQIKTDKGHYTLFSGGEKCRLNLAIMCALNDTFISMHGRQCNIQVLDEIDKELDPAGVEEYVRLVVDDLSNRIPTTLIISHKDDICYAFPTQIKVTKEGELSYIRN